MKLLLASGSVTRRQMLERAGVSFEVVAPAADEEIEKRRLIAARTSPVEIALSLAELKARSVAEADVLILGSDQVLEQEDGTMLSKPGSREEAREQLSALAGRRHQLHSAAALVGRGEVAWRSVETVGMKMRPLSGAYVDSYLDAEFDSVRHNVGCYRIEGLGAQLFEEVDGSHFAVLGLPLLPLLAELRRRGAMTS
jgi:septum formation protein